MFKSSRNGQHPFRYSQGRPNYAYGELWVGHNRKVKTPVIVIVGPTASGKSSLAIDVAQALINNGTMAEIINADSMLVYRGMNIGTAKPTKAELATVRHHLVDILEVTETASVADFQRLAREAIADCRRRNVVPIVVGGSALYIRAIVDDFDFPGTDPKIRAKWQAKCDQIGAHALHQILTEKDPKAAAGIEPGNGRRIVRALEVIELTGSFKSTLPEWTYLLEKVFQFGLRLSRDEMDQRIEDRVERMWQAGLVAEVEQLRDQGLDQGLTASRGLGYSQVLGYLHGEYSEDEAKELTITGTRKFSRRQLSWFRRDPRIKWLAAGDVGNVDKIVACVLSNLSNHHHSPED